MLMDARMVQVLALRCRTPRARYNAVPNASFHAANLMATAVLIRDNRQAHVIVSSQLRHCNAVVFGVSQTVQRHAQRKGGENEKGEIKKLGQGASLHPCGQRYHYPATWGVALVIIIQG